eukprot:scaffold190174_cov29-Tisochrysis_lutea.AAC.1
MGGLAGAQDGHDMWCEAAICHAIPRQRATYLGQVELKEVSEPKRVAAHHDGALVPGRGPVRKVVQPPGAREGEALVPAVCGTIEIQRHL